MLLLLLLPMLMLIIIGLTYPLIISFKLIAKCDNFLAKCDRFYKVQQNIPQAKMFRIPEYGALCKGRIFGRIRSTDLGYEKTTTITKTNNQ